MRKQTIDDKRLEDAIRRWHSLHNPAKAHRLRLTKKLRAAIAAWVSANLTGEVK